MTNTEVAEPRKKTAARKSSAQRKTTRASGLKEVQARIISLLDTFEQQIGDKSLKMSVSDYIRLLQIKREFDEQKPKDIEVTWVDSLKEKSDSGK